ncbi:MAG: NAD(P)H-dependent oxidoreductase [Firmicutes bacterium]|nr:NAD(P)H-dependent oxidoreductase [Bacillota bacterium]
MEILLVNSCVRKKSRTIKLARQLAKKLGGNVTEVFLEKERIKPLYGLPLVDRSILLEAGELWDDTFNYARQFADADIIIFAAPYWDLSFPAILKIYIETINIVNIAFEYGPNNSVIPLCKASKLFYVTTSGGTIVNDSFGYGYVKELAEFFWGIKETHLIKVEGLDAEGADVPAIMENAIAHIKAEDF